MFIKIGVDAGLTPFTLVAGRLLVGSILLGRSSSLRDHSLPRDARMYLKIAILGFFAIALPFVLITIAEQHVPRVGRHADRAGAALRDPFLGGDARRADHAGQDRGHRDRHDRRRRADGFRSRADRQDGPDLQLVLVGATVSYGFGGVFARKYVTRAMRPMVPAFIEVTSAMLMVALGSLLLENPIGLITALRRTRSSPCSGWASSAPVWPISRSSALSAPGAQRAPRSVAYLLPVWGIALGLIVLNEPLQSGLIAGHRAGHRRHRLRQPRTASRSPDSTHEFGVVRAPKLSRKPPESAR